MQQTWDNAYAGSGAAARDPQGSREVMAPTLVFRALAMQS
jgi:hypothetical protein